MQTRAAGQLSGPASQPRAQARLLPVSWRQSVPSNRGGAGHLSLIDEALSRREVVDGQSELGDQRRIRSANRNCR
jgi:hypothetical protein